MQSEVHSPKDLSTTKASTNQLQSDLEISQYLIISEKLSPQPPTNDSKFLAHYTFSPSGESSSNEIVSYSQIQPHLSFSLQKEEDSIASDGQQIPQKQMYQKERQQESDEETRKRLIAMRVNRMMEAQCYLKQGKNQWRKVQFRVSTQMVKMGPISIDLETLIKIKIFPISEFGLPNKNTVKLTIVSNQFIFSLSRAQRYGDYPLPFTAFSRIISKKLKLHGIYRATQWSSHFQNLPEEAFKDSPFIFGKIFKKSQFWKKWEPRYVMVAKCGIKSFQISKSKEVWKKSFEITAASLKYMWTRFQCLEKEVLDEKGQTQMQKFLVIKVMHDMKEKTEFAVPICDFGNKNSETRNWLLAFYRLFA